MTWLRKIAGIASREHSECELREELQHHIELKTQENIEAGMSPEEARYAALRAFGGVEQKKEQCRDADRLRWLEDLIQDVRYGLRQLRRSPGFSAVAVLTLSLGIGANAAIFSVAYLDLIRPLPYPQANRLVMFGVVVPGLDSRPFLFRSSYLQLRNSNTPFESMASWRPGIRGCNLQGPQPARMACAQVESTFLSTFGVHPVLGRNFSAANNRPGARDVCLISYGLWQGRFATSPKVLGRLLSINGKPVRIIGVLPRHFEWPTLAHVDIVLPEKLPVMATGAGLGPAVRAYARLKPGVTIAQAAAQLQPFLERFVHSAPPMFRKEIRLGIISVREDQVGSIRLALGVLFGGALALLLLGAANVTNLLLTRSEARQREFAVRAALGAARWRLVRLRLVETTFLGLGGGIVGAALACGVLRLCIILAPAGIPRMDEAHIGLPALFLVAGASLLSGLLCGLGSLTAIRTSSLHPAALAPFSPRGRLGPSLVALQVAVSLVLLAGAGLLFATYRNIRNIPLGMDTNHIVTAGITLDKRFYSQPGEAAEYFRRVKARLGALPGVRGVAVSDSLPPGGPEHACTFSQLQAGGRPPFEKGTGGLVGWRAVSPGYFKILNIPIIEGRGFVMSDQDPDVSVIVLSKMLASRLFPGENPIGRRLRSACTAGSWYEVAGIVANIKNAGLVRQSDPEYYVVRKNEPDLGLPGLPADLQHAYFLVRSPLAVSGIDRMVRRAIASVEPSMPAAISTLDARVQPMLAAPRFDAVLTGLFAALGLLLAAVGLYGLASYSVTRRTHEIGVRMALGAQERDVLATTVIRELKAVFVGIAAGIGGALAVTRFLSSLLYGVKPADPLTFVAVTLILICVALMACYIPARRAAKIDPVVALRYE